MLTLSIVQHMQTLAEQLKERAPGYGFARIELDNLLLEHLPELVNLAKTALLVPPEYTEAIRQLHENCVLPTDMVQG